MTLEEILTSDNIITSINDNLDYLVNLIPEIKMMFNFPHNHPHHHLDVWNHTLLALSKSPSDYEIRLVLLLHDIGKPLSYQDEDGIRHFKGHADKSSEISYLILKRLLFDENEIKRLCYLIKYHDTPITKDNIVEDYELTYKRYIIQECDALAHHPDKLSKRLSYLDQTKKLLLAYKGGNE